MDDAQKLMLYDASKKSVLVAYLLWSFLGSVGAHRFYAGKTRSAVVMLLLFLVSWPLTLILVGFVTFAIAGLWWLIDAFLIPGMIEDYNLRLAAAYGR